MKKQISVSVFFLILLAAAVISTYFVISPANDKAAVPPSAEVPEGVTLISWDEASPENSMEELEKCLSELAPGVAVKKEEELRWKDVCPRFFWVESFSVTTYENADFKLYNFSYLDDAADNKKMRSEIDLAAQEIISAAEEKNSGSRWEDILTVHDELVRRTEFVGEDENAAHLHDLYGALVLKRAVCQGYTYAFSYILGRMGYSCTEIYSDEHIWTKIDSLSSGEKYIDLTWDDYNNADVNGQPYIHHEFFCLSKEEMEQFDEHTPEDDDDTELNAAVGDNYYRRRNYYIKKNDELGFRACALEQYEQGKNLLEFRFEDRNDFEKADEWMISILRELGYSEASYYVYSKPELLTYSAGLYAPPKE